MINLNKLEKLESSKDSRLTNEQQVMMDYNLKQGFEAYLEEYSDYCYLVLVKEGVKNGIKRLNRTGHNVHVG